jgi:hypothetical protein
LTGSRGIVAGVGPAHRNSEASRPPNFAFHLKNVVPLILCRRHRAAHTGAGQSHADRSSARPKDASDPAARWKFPGSLQKKGIAFSTTYCALPPTNWGGEFSSFRWGLLLKALRKARSRCLDQLPVFELALKKRGRRWRWSVCTAEGDVVMMGSESSRPAAKYKADRALFLLLESAPYRSIRQPRSPEYGRWLEPLKRVAPAHKK